VIRPTTTEITEVEGILYLYSYLEEGQIIEQQLDLHIKFIDTPGFKDIYDLKCWYKMIKKYIKEKVLYYYNNNSIPSIQ
jgi:septin family protein